METNLLLAQLPFLDVLKPRNEPAKTFKVSNPSFQFHFGIGLETLSLINTSIFIVIFETNFRKIKYLLERLSKEEQSKIQFAYDGKMLESVARKLAFSKGDYVVLESHKKSYELFLLLIENVKLQYSQLDFSLKNDWKSLVQNSSFNHHQIDQNIFKNKPCIIVGAGFSLNERIEEIKKHQHSCFIFSSLRAVPKLLQYEITPDFVGVIDPQEYLEMPKHIFESVPCFYILNANFLQVQPFKYKIPICTMSDFPFLPVFQNHFLEDKAPVEASHTVSGFLVSLATSFQMSKIILYGVDLCYREDKKYWLESYQKKENLFSVQNGSGQLVMTKSDFLLSKNWFEWLCKNSRKKSYINRSIGLELKGFRKNLCQLGRHIKKKASLINKEPDKTWLEKLSQNLDIKSAQNHLHDETFWILLESDLHDLGLLEPMKEVFNRFCEGGLLEETQKKPFFLTIIGRIQEALYNEPII